MPASTDARSPVLIDARTLKAGREELRVSFDSYRGFDYASMRKWWRDADGSYKPGKGLTVRPEHLPWLRQAIDQAIEIGLREGLIDEEAFEAAGLPLPAALTD